MTVKGRWDGTRSRAALRRRVGESLMVAGAVAVCCAGALGRGPVHAAQEESLATLGGKVADIAGTGDRLLLCVGSQLYVLSIPETGAVPVLSGVAGPFESRTVSVASDERFAYVALGSGAVAVVDVSRGDTPRLLATVPFAADPVRVAIENQLLFYAVEAAGQAAVKVLDASRPGELRAVAEIRDPLGVFIGDIAAHDGRLYAAAGLQGLMVWDVADASHPRVVGAAEDVRALRIDVDGDLLVALVNRVVHVGTAEVIEEGLAFYAVSDSGQLEQAGELWMDVNLADVSVRFGKAYVQAGGSVVVVDAADPSHPVSVGRSLNVTPSASLAGKPFLHGDRLFLGRSAGSVVTGPDESPRFECLDLGVSVVDVRVAAAMSLIGTWSVPVPGETRLVAGDGGRLAVADTCGVRLMDVTMPTAPTQRSYVAAFEYYLPQFMALDGSLLYVLDDIGALTIVDVSNLDVPAVLSRTELKPADPGSRGGVRGLAVEGATAVVLSYHGYLTVVDANDPFKPAVIFDGDVLPSGTRGGVLRNGLLYAATDYGLVTVDISVRAHPRWLAAAGRSVRALAVDSGVAYAAVAVDQGDGDRSGLLDVIDVADASRPVVIASLDMTLERGSALPPWSASLYRNLVVVSAASARIHVIDVATRADPQHRTAIELPAVSNGAAVIDGTVYVAAGPAGLVTIEGSLEELSTATHWLALPVLLSGR
jgi:hypothetical protein